MNSSATPPPADAIEAAADFAPRLLFVPVSGAFGMGEYARCSAIARGATQRWPGACIRFVLSRRAPYAAQVPFPSTLLDSSATFHSAAVIDVIRSWRPDIVIFDNAGRTAQLAEAQRLGACVVFISARRRQRNRAFRLKWMQLIDEHWFAYPSFIVGELGRLERLKLRLLNRPAVRYLDVILARPAARSRESAAARLGCEPGAYVLVVPGGGTGHPAARGAVDRFLDTARGLVANGVETVFVGPTAAAPSSLGPRAEPATAARLRLLAPLPQADLGELMRGARLIITNGGATLLQAIACGKACIAVPIAGDQAERIRRCAAAGVVVPATLDVPHMLAAAIRLLGDPAACASLAQRAAGLHLADGLDVAVGALGTLLAAHVRHAPPA